MSALVTEGRHPSPPASLARGAGLIALLILIGMLPGRRPEERDRIARFANVSREWAADVTVRAWPNQFRVAWRLMLPPLLVAARYAAFGAMTLMFTSLFLAWADASPPSDPRAIGRMLAVYGGLLPTLLALAHVTIANGLSVQTSDYVRYAALPLPTHDLLKRMLLVGALGGALLDTALAMTWGLLVQRDPGVAVLFSVGVVFLLFAALCGYIALVSTQWSRWLRLAPVAASTWVVVPAAILIWQFHILRRSPEMLRPVAVAEILASIVTIGAVWMAIGRMVAEREPAAGI